MTRRISGCSIPMQAPPMISVTILVKNGGAKLARCLQAIFAQETRHSFEVVIVDSGSTDGTHALYRTYPVRLFEIRPQDFQFGRTRDYAVEMARGRYVVILSQDAVPANERWLNCLVAPLLADAEVAAVQGYCRLPEGEPLFYWERKGLFYFTRESERWIRDYHGIGFSNVNSAVRRSVWEKIRFGSVPMSEDKAFQQKLVAQGHRVAQAPEALVYHAHTYDVVGLTKRCLNEGLGYRAIGWRYRWWECGLDLVNPTMWLTLRYGLADREVRSVSELLFPLIRPLALLIGNRCFKRYIQ